MDTNREQQLQHIREKAQAISTRVKQDPAFAERMKANPRQTMLEEGIPSDAIGDLLNENMRGDDDVAGYQLCLDYTCIISRCPGSCYVTIGV